MALPATDNFNRADGALGANWSGSVGGDLAVNTNRCGAGTSGDCSMYWSADAPDAAQYAQVKMSGVEAGMYKGPTVRTSSTDWVVLDAAAASWSIEWYNGGSWTAVGSTYSTAPANNDIGKLTADGDNFKAYVNGTERISGSPAGTAPSTGYGGIYIYTTAHYVDDFEVGNLGGAAGVGIPLVMNDQRMRRA